MASNGKVVDEDVPPKKESTLDFLWNKETKAFLGRTGGSWAKIGVFYCIFYLALAGWFAGLLQVFRITLDPVRPTYFGTDSLLQDNPGLGVRPMPLYDTTLIRFKQGDRGSYLPYIDHLDAFLQNYRDAPGAVECNGTKPAPGKACKIDVDDLLEQAGCSRKTDFGFQDGTPCIAVKINKLYGFDPDAYNTSAQFEEYGVNTTDISWSPKAVGLGCQGANAIDQQNLKELKYYPSTGISKNFFPYENQDGYRSPIVIVKMADVEKRVTIQVVCRVYADNVDNTDGKELRGSAHFELLID